jgi:hypothetical protein
MCREAAASTSMAPADLGVPCLPQRSGRILVPRLAHSRWTLVLWAVLCPGIAQAAESGLPAELHPWGRFKPGAWKLYRVVTETLDEHGKVVDTTTTFTTTTLQATDGPGVLVLRTEAVVEVSGKRLEAQPSLVRQGLHGETAGDKVSILPMTTGEIEIQGRKIPCKIVQVQTSGPNGATVAKTWFSPALAPYVLRRESRTTDATGKSVLSETILQVTAMHVPCDLVPNSDGASQVLVTTTHPKGKTVTKALTSTDVPGGVICHTAEEFDANGRLIRRSTLTLIDYDVTPKKDRSGLFNRLRARGHRSHRAPK